MALDWKAEFQNPTIAITIHDGASVFTRRGKWSEVSMFLFQDHTTGELGSCINLGPFDCMVLIIILIGVKRGQVHMSWNHVQITPPCPRGSSHLDELW